MVKGVNLTLLIGPAVPVPAPRAVIDSLQSVQVNSGKEVTGFELRFAVDRKSELINTLLPAGYFDPIITRVIIIVTLNGLPRVIMDGLVTQQDYAPSNEVGQSTLSVKGRDLSVAMDLVEVTMPFPAVPDVGKIYAKLAPYAFLGIVPLVIPPIIPRVQSPTDGWESQTASTDLNFIKTLASRAGYVFYVAPGPLPGQSTAYFGPDLNLPIPQAALSANMDAHANVESLSFSLDGEAKKVRIFTILDPVTKKIPIPIPIPNVNLFKPPLGARPTPPAKIEFEAAAAKDDPSKAAGRILGFLMSNSAAISGSGSLDVLRYGSVLQPRMLVGVRGASPAYDGMYYVDSVTHDIKPGEYKQNFNLSRDGLISNTPRVMV
jgi:hypothetical protein